MANKISVWITYWEKVKKIAVCDCFLDVAIGLIHDGFFSLDKNIQDRVIKKTIEKSAVNEEMYVLISNVTVLCCRKSVFQFDLKKIISEEKLNRECFVDLPFIDEGYENCVFYLEAVDYIDDFKNACVPCIKNILCSIAEKLYLFKKCTIMED